MPFWHRLAVVGVVMLITVVVARLIDRRIARRQLAPEAITRYRVVRRSVTTAIVFVGLLSALLVIPNEKLASDTIRNSTIRSREKVAEISVQVPLGQDVGAIVDRLRGLAEGADAFVTELAGNATVVVRAQADDERAAERLERELRLRAHEVLRAEGVFA